MSLRNLLLGSSSMMMPLFDAENGSGGGAPGGGGGGAPDPKLAATPPAGVPGGGTGGAPDPAAAAAGGTLAGGGADPKAAAAAALKPSDLPKDFNWRLFLAGGDEKAAKDLEKYTDLPAVYKSLRDLQGKISKGELKAPPKELAADATDEQKAQWRKDNGLPASPEDMVKGLQLSDGVVIGEADKPLVGEFAKMMFEAGASQAETNRAVDFYYGMQARAEAAMKEADGQHKQTAMEDLMKDWGPENYKANMNAKDVVLSKLSEADYAALLTARTPDGQMIGNSAWFNRVMATLGREIAPAATIITGGDGSVKSIDTELASIEETARKAMSGDGEAHRAYYGYGGRPGLEVRERELIDAKMKMESRAGKAA